MGKQKNGEVKIHTKYRVDLMETRGGEGSCPYHKQVNVKWIIKGDYRQKIKGKVIYIERDPKTFLGTIDCEAYSDGRCQVDLATCPVEKILEHFAK